MSEALFPILPCAWLLVGGYFVARRRYFLPRYRWRLVLFLNVLLATGYVGVWSARPPVLGLIAFAVVMGAISAALLLYEYRFPKRGKQSRRSVEDTFG
jgi:hypothetical protein